MKTEHSWRRISAWCLYDFANSSYSAVIASAIFPVYFANYIVGNEKGLGDLWWGRAISLSMLFVVLSSPFMGYVADSKGKKRELLTIYTFVCILAVASMSFLKPGYILFGFFTILIANTAMEAGLVFYNAFIPYIVGKELYGRISAYGFGVGYMGSILSLLFALYLVSKGKYELIWPMVAVFYTTFALPCLYMMPSGKNSAADYNRRSLKAHFIGLFLEFKQVLTDKNARLFLAAYFLYEDGINTVIIFASIFAATTLGFKYQELVVLYVLVQTTAFIGSFMVARQLDNKGPKVVLIVTLIMWSFITLSCVWVKSKTYFWILAILSGLGLGSAQAASRTMFLGYVPSSKEGQYFGIYAMVGKSSAIVGPFLFGQVSYLFGSQRPAAAVIFLMFVLGLFLLLPVRQGQIHSR